MFLHKVLLSITILFLAIGCSDDSSTNPENKNSISGKVAFLDGTPASNASVRLIIPAGNQSKLSYTDENGFYLFDDLSNGTYAVSFISQIYTINSYRTEDFELRNNSVTKDITVTYAILDEQKVLVVNDSLFFIQYHPDNAKIGGNYDVVDAFVGYYRDNGNTNTLACDVYEVPLDLDWQNPGIDLTADYVRTNFNFLFELTDTYQNNFHYTFINGENIEKLLNDPGNGFLFLRKDSLDKTLQVPCVDFNNNDFGLQIEYK